MRLAFLVTAYRDLVQLGRLCTALRTAEPDGLLRVQFDSGSPLAAGARLLAVDVRFTDRPIRWGDGSYTLAILSSMRELLRDEWDWMVLLSGQDHVVRPLSGLREVLSADGVRAFSAVNASLQTSGPRRELLEQRYFYRYHWPRSSWPRSARSIVARLGAPLQAATFGRLRVQPRPRGAAPGLGVRRSRDVFSDGRGCWLGSDYFAVRRSMVDELLAYLDREPEVLDYFLGTFVPSEGLFPSLFRWISPDEVADRYFHFMRFGSAANPRLLTPSDLGEMWASGAFFARKFADDDAWVEDVFPLTAAPAGYGRTYTE